MHKKVSGEHEYQSASKIILFFLSISCSLLLVELEHGDHSLHTLAAISVYLAAGEMSGPTDVQVEKTKTNWASLREYKLASKALLHDISKTDWQLLVIRLPVG